MHRYRAFVALAAFFVLLLAAGNPARSQRGAGWTPPENFSSEPGLFSDSPLALCDTTQNLHILWVERDDTRAIVYYRSDRGGVWSPKNDILLTRSVRFMDAAITPDGTLHLVWVDTVEGNLQYSRAPLVNASDARSWTTPQVILQDLDAGSNVFAGGGTIRSDARGRLHIVAGKKNDPDSLSHSLIHIRSDDGGRSWSAPVEVMEIATSEPSDLFGGLAIDGAGRLHVGWQVRSYKYGAYSELGYVRSTDDGSTWSRPEVLIKGTLPINAGMPAVFAFGRDKIHFTWDTPDRLHRWSSNGGETWSAPGPFLNLGAALGGFNKLAEDSSGTLYGLAAVRDGVYSVVWRGGAWTDTETIDTRDIDPHTQQLVACQGNQLHVFYHDRTGPNEIWHSTKSVAAPSIPRGPVTGSDAPRSVVTPHETPAKPSATQRSGAAFSSAELLNNDRRGIPERTDGTAPVIAGVVLSLALVILAGILSLTRSARF